MTTKDVLVPDIGDEEAEVIELCVSPGDSVAEDDSLVTVESDKASMDIPAPFAGKLSEFKIAVGDKIKQGDLLALMDIDSDDSDDSDKEADSGGDSSDGGADDESRSDTAESDSSSTETADKEATESSGDNTSKTGDSVTVTVPDIGDASDVEVIEVLVKVGDTVAEEDGLITLETDKATMDVPASQAGTVKSIEVKVGDKVSKGSVVLELEGEGNSSNEQSSADKAESADDSGSKDRSDSQSSKGSSQTVEVNVPDIGDASDVEVIEVLVAEGDSINAEDGLITLETDKATMDVPAPEAGTVKSLKVKVGDKVSKGSLVLLLETAAEESESSSKTSSEDKQSDKKAQPESSSQSGDSAGSAQKPPPVPHHPSAGERKPSGSVHASPSVRRLAREFGVDLTQVTATGPKTRILKEDVQSFVKYELSRPKMTAGSNVSSGGGGLQVLAPPKVDFSKFGEVEEKPLTRIQKISGPNLHRNWVTIPHVTQFEEADITDLEAFRKEQNAIAEKRKLGVKITPLVFMMKACADALKAYPIFNTSLSESGESLIQKKYYHIGIAVDTPGGLVVPVVRDVDKKGIMELSKELTEISIKARDGKLKSADMQGSCFTISSLGGIGGTAFTPIVNAPDVAILGVSKSEMKPKWNGKDFEPRLMLPLSLSYDHRVIDGAVAARFAVHLSNVLGDLRQILL
ncbi:dihydrolipoyllysine-residue acetyltransferase [Alteromonas oceanisediminis]|uniref:dihydrolipoyllysine-residue acetyltransferase n=1 Tax=Alteromonas oceanisediminis TaxID=2836180 RepID=UPI001BDA86CF|nr:dihydrolipoyllysine-residue acetyltransferase [Alteromonas oceanisediminis]MBT0585549.1 dihydrolipoyllysine-residue acetyltransferase [Alteromonas oceanisediminis]